MQSDPAELLLSQLKKELESSSKDKSRIQSYMDALVSLAPGLAKISAIYHSDDKSNGRFRRNFAVAVCSGKGSFTIRFADLRSKASPAGVS
jgi:hypothetical protein